MVNNLLLLLSFLLKLLLSKSAPDQHKSLVRHIPAWPPHAPGGEPLRNISVTILLPQDFYSGNLKRNVPESEAKLLAAQKRAGPAILAGLEEGVRRGQAGSGEAVNFDVVIRDTKCDITYAAKVGIDRELIYQLDACMSVIM